MSRRVTFILVLVVVLLASCRNGEKTVNTELNTKDPAKKVLNDLNSKIESDPKNADNYDNRARYYTLESQFDLALKDVNRAITLSPDVPKYYLTLSDIYLKLSKPVNCEDALKKALSLDPKFNPALLRMAMLKLYVKEYKESMGFVKQALDAEPINPEAYFTKSLVLLESGDTVKAVADLKKAVDQNQDYFEAIMKLGELYSMRKDPLTEAYFKNALRILPDNHAALYKLGLYYQESGQYETAIKTYSTLAKVDTSDKNAPFNIGYIYLVYLKDYAKAIPFFSQSIQKDPGSFKAYFNRGYAYELSGQYDNAAKDYQMSLSIRTNYPNAIDGLNRLDKRRKK